MPATAVQHAPAFRPLYLQLKDLLLRDMETRQWRPGEALPSEIELAARFGVSQGTVRKAIDALASDNLVVRRSDGRDEYPASRLLDVRRGKASAEVARLLELKASDAVFVIRRVLEYGGEPAVLDDITLPATLFKGLTRARLQAYRGSMYGFFETQFGVRTLRAQERLKAIAADSATAAVLKVRTGEPLLAVERLTRTYGERPVEWRRGLCSTRRHYYLNELG